MAKTLSGKAVVKILVKHFGFRVVSQKGSHIKLQKNLGTVTVGTIVPNHKELASGTLKGALKLAKVDKHAFWKHV
ncbi:MAG: type II toxin-antitoxin system HicA family toxin [Patescibacteria group bacterium]